MSTVRIENLIYPETSLTFVKFPPPGKKQVENHHPSFKESSALKWIAIIHSVKHLWTETEQEEQKCLCLRYKMLT